MNEILTRIWSTSFSFFHLEFLSNDYSEDSIEKLKIKYFFDIKVLVLFKKILKKIYNQEIKKKRTRKKRILKTDIFHYVPLTEIRNRALHGNFVAKDKWLRDILDCYNPEYCYIGGW